MAIDVYFAKPAMLYFLLIIPLLITFHFVSSRYSSRKAILFANFEALRRVSKKYSIKNHTDLLILRSFVILCIILVLAGTKIIYDGVGDTSNYVIVIDSSVSMLSVDATISRFSIAKVSSIEFIRSLPQQTEVGLVTFASVSRIENLMTNDKGILESSISNLSIQRESGTNLGDAIINSANLLQTREGTRKIILLSDGQSNLGVHFEDSIDFAIENNVVIHTIGIGSESGSLGEGIGLEFSLNEDNLYNIANLTSGTYNKALTASGVNDIFNEIKEDKYQKISLDLQNILLSIITIVLLIEFIFVKTIYKITP